MHTVVRTYIWSLMMYAYFDVVTFDAWTVGNLRTYVHTWLIELGVDFSKTQITYVDLHMTSRVHCNILMTSLHLSLNFPPILDFLPESISWCSFGLTKSDVRFLYQISDLQRFLDRTVSPYPPPTWRYVVVHFATLPPTTNTVQEPFLDEYTPEIKTPH